MAEPLKELFFNRAAVARIGAGIARVAPGFPEAAFVADATRDLDRLELKARSAAITAALGTHLPQDFAQAAAILVAALGDEAPLGGPAIGGGPGLTGFVVMPLADYVADRGGADFDTAMWALKVMTARFSSEFAIRPFLIREPARTLAVLRGWTEDPNPHVRRLVSEGSRPRLPWAPRLPAFIRDPAPVLDLALRLRDDPEPYVRRSVANSLNDIAKDHPDLIAALAADWLRDAPPGRAWIVRHACRSLVKQGHPGALAALGLNGTAVQLAAFRLATPEVRLGGALEFEVELAAGDGTGGFVLDYAVHHRKANGGLSAKVFKWRTGAAMPGILLRLVKRHPMRPITTRRYYPGLHRLAIHLNGAEVAAAEFNLGL